MNKIVFASTTMKMLQSSFSGLGGDRECFLTLRIHTSRAIEGPPSRVEHGAGGMLQGRSDTHRTNLF